MVIKIAHVVGDLVSVQFCCRADGVSAFVEFVLVPDETIRKGLS